MFRQQLRAILRAAVFGKVSVMFPMITSVHEVIRAKELMQEAAGELEQEGICWRMPEIGIMIETPAAVMMSAELAEQADFFSIGTNDLTQYVLACDRQNPRLENLYNDHHPAVLKMIDMVVKNGHNAGIWVGVCGELGADTGMTKTLLDMGVDEISVSPSKILEIRNQINTGGNPNAKGNIKGTYRE
jgi:phosphotransferase system enzyme I (PtsI)